jgi:hypothetical protein
MSGLDTVVDRRPVVWDARPSGKMSGRMERRPGGVAFDQAPDPDLWQRRQEAGRLPGDAFKRARDQGGPRLEEARKALDQHLRRTVRDQGERDELIRMLNRFLAVLVGGSEEEDEAEPQGGRWEGGERDRGGGAQDARPGGRVNRIDRILAGLPVPRKV